ncbi:hypothetical protein ADUPG1_013054 [Aduncisulcus paluster]|uniref:Uncharacterized protein n=1 Tax=Aduncisulcus paluster TaxID=2918883 RepID=A0ABQ5K1K9_9EUKA|nr:hypothetical protein ADUPG1_013054 [Aduncisulcus paluster]
MGTLNYETKKKFGLIEQYLTIEASILYSILQSIFNIGVPAVFRGIVGAVIGFCAIFSIFMLASMPSPYVTKELFPSTAACCAIISALVFIPLYQFTGLKAASFIRKEYTSTNVASVVVVPAVCAVIGAIIGSVFYAFFVMYGLNDRAGYGKQNFNLIPTREILVGILPETRGVDPMSQSATVSSFIQKYMKPSTYFDKNTVLFFGHLLELRFPAFAVLGAIIGKSIGYILSIFSVISREKRRREKILQLETAKAIQQLGPGRSEKDGEKIAKRRVKEQLKQEKKQRRKKNKRRL